MRNILISLLVAGGLVVSITARPDQPATKPSEEKTEPAPSSPAKPPEVRDLGTRKSGSDWPGFLGPTGDGKSTERIRTDWPLPILWHKKIGDGYSMPSIAKGRLYLFDRHDGNARLSSWHSETGEEIWRSEYPSEYEDYYDYSKGPRASPVIDEDRVFTLGVEGVLRAHHAADGEVIWQIDTTAEYGVVKNFFGVGSTPVIEGDLLIVPIGGSPPGSPKIHSGEVKGNGTGIVAFDKRTGEVRYSVTDTLASYATPTLATINGRRWGFAFNREGLVGFAPETGAVDFIFPWRAKILESVNAASPVVVDDTVFVTECYGPGSALLRVEPGKHEVVWQDPRRPKSMESHWNTPIYHQGYLYGSSGRSTGNAELRCVEHATGKVVWSEPGLGRASLLYADGHFIVLGEYGMLTLVKATPDGYEKVAEMDFGVAKPPEADAKTPVDTGTDDRPVLRFPAWNAPILSHGLLYVRGKDQLICLDLQPKAS